MQYFFEHYEKVCFGVCLVIKYSEKKKGGNDEHQLKTLCASVEDGRRKGALSQAWKIHSFLQVQQVSVSAADSPCLVDQRVRKQLLQPNSSHRGSQQRGQQQLQPRQHSSQAFLVTGFRVVHSFVSVFDTVPAQEVLSNHKLSPQ